MKKKVLVLILFILLIVPLYGCGKEESSESDMKWKLNLDIKENNLPSYVLSIFNRAKENYSDMELQPISLLGTQVVSGMNYMILCYGDNNFQVVVVYNDIKSNASINSVTKLNIDDYINKDIKISEESLLGGWHVNGDNESLLDTDSDNTFMNSVMLEDDLYLPIVLLASNENNGLNSLILALVKTDERYHLSVLTINNDEEKILSKAFFSLSKYNK